MQSPQIAAVPEHATILVLNRFPVKRRLAPSLPPAPPVQPLHHRFLDAEMTPHGIHGDGELPLCWPAALRWVRLGTGHPGTVPATQGRQPPSMVPERCLRGGVTSRLPPLMTERRERFSDVAVIGAGLSGLVAARTLATSGVSVHVLEARRRVGGRTLTWHPHAGDPEERTADTYAFDLGATWCWPHQHKARRLAAELRVDTFAQFQTGDAVYDAGESAPAQRFLPLRLPDDSLRFVGGAQRLSERLAAELGRERLSLEVAARTVEANSGGVRVAAERTNGDRVHFQACFVVVALPPRLILHSIRFAPDLPPDLKQAMEGTPTWMASAAKCVLVYADAFWRERGLSGLGISHAGPLGEIHDAATPDGLHPALFGFFTRGTDRTLTPEARKARVVRQLSRMFGPEAAHPLRYRELDWTGELYTSTPQDARPLVEHPAYGHPAFQRAALHGRVYWAGSETASREGGYLEGAVWSGENMAQEILARLRSGSTTVQEE